MTLRTALWLAGAPWLVLGALGCEPVKLGECKSPQDCKGYEYCDTKLGACGLKPCTANDECSLDGRCDVQNAYCVAAPCDPACPSFEGCAHGACVGRYLGITILQPTDGGTVGANATVRALLDVDPRFQRQDPASLALTVTPGTGTIALLPQTGGNYSGTWNPTADRMYGLVVAYPDAGIQSTGVNVHADLIPPVLTVTVPPPSRRPNDAGWAQDYDDVMPNAWRRDESAIVQVSSNEALNPATVQVMLYGIGDGGTPGPLGMTVPLSLSCGTDCFEGSVDLGQPMMRVGRGTMEVVATANDQVGNTGAVDGGIGVTRVRWIFTASATDPIKTAPAIGPSGRVYFGTASGTGTAGALWTVESTGELKWTANTGALEASPAVGRGGDGGIETVYAAFNSPGNAVVLAAFDSTGIESYRHDTTGKALAGVGIGNTQYVEAAPLESAFILLNEGGGKLTALRPSGDPGYQYVSTPDAGIGAFPAAIGVTGTKVFYGNRTTAAYGYQFGTSGWSQLAGWPVSVGKTVTSVIPTSSEVIGTAGALAEGGAFAVSLGDGGINWRYPTSFSGGLQAWPAAFTTIGLVYPTSDGAGTNTSLVRVAPHSTAADTVPISSESQSAPVVGSDGVLYVTETSGSLEVFRSDLTADWTLDLSGAISASPNMDCRRDENGARQHGHATLYVATMSGQLYSIITDSNGIDTTAPWPRYQHDPRNTGNSDTPLSEFTCP